MVLALAVLQLTPCIGAGALLLVGGGTTTPEMAEKFGKLIGGKSELVYVLPQTRADVQKGDSSVGFLKRNGFTRVELLSNDTFTPQELSEAESKLSKAKGLWIPGGDQNLFTKRFGLEFCHRVFPKLIQSGTCWFGTSAGAMLVSDPMIGGNNSDGTPKVVPGLGLADALVDTHYLVRKREPRLRSAFFRHRHQWGFGLDEGEWVVLRDNQIEEKHGEPKIIVRE